MCRWLAAAVIGLMAACTSQPPAPVPSAIEAPPGFPGAFYREAAARGTRVFAIDPAESLVAIEVYRGGALARLGHDHVIASHALQGFVAPALGRADLYVPLDRMFVDEPRLRAEAGFDTQPSAEDIEGTRRNMLKALEAERHPFALISVVRGDASGSVAPWSVSLTLHGVTRASPVAVQVDVAAGAVAITGRLALKQTDFGITPLSVLGGAIQVQDEVKVRFDVRARAMD